MSPQCTGPARSSSLRRVRPSARPRETSGRRTESGEDQQLLAVLCALSCARLLRHPSKTSCEASFSVLLTIEDIRINIGHPPCQIRSVNPFFVVADFLSQNKDRKIEATLCVAFFSRKGKEENKITSLLLTPYMDRNVELGLSKMLDTTSFRSTVVSNLCDSRPHAVNQSVTFFSSSGT